MMNVLLNILTLLLSAQRYTGYGRGYDWGGWNIGFLDYPFWVLFFIVLIGGGIMVLIEKLKGTKSIPSSSKSLTSSLYEYKKHFVKYNKGCVVDNNDGEYFDLCIFTDKNNIDYYIGFSAYLKPLTYEEMQSKEKELFLRYDIRGGNLLCSEESEELRSKDSIESSNGKEYKIAGILYCLNKKTKDKDLLKYREEKYTITKF